jgi:hypothetical protein
VVAEEEASCTSICAAGVAAAETDIAIQVYRWLCCYGKGSENKDSNKTNVPYKHAVKLSGKIL